MILPTKWGKFNVCRIDGGKVLIVTGRASLGGQPYRVVLRLFQTGDGWGRRQYEDLRMTKVGGPNAGKPARLAAREIMVDYLPELVNSVIGDE